MNEQHRVAVIGAVTKLPFAAVAEAVKERLGDDDVLETTSTCPAFELIPSPTPEQSNLPKVHHESPKEHFGSKKRGKRR